MKFGPLLEWWGNLSPGWRYGVALVILAVSTGAWLLEGRIWPGGFAIGAALLIAAGFNFDS
jgi:hypothetical protein